MLPHFVVTGPSSAGKSTVARSLPPLLPECVVLDRDLWWREEFQGPEFFEFSLRLCSHVSQSGRPVVQCGALLPENLEPCVERRSFTVIHYLALVCDDAVLERRLRARFPAMDKLEEYVAYHLDFNRYLKANAATLSPPVVLLDTSTLGEEATLASVRDWVRGRMISSPP